MDLAVRCTKSKRTEELHCKLSSVFFAQAPAPKAAPAPKKAAKKGAAPAAPSMGFSGVPADFSRPVVNCPSGYPSEADAQTVRAPPHFCPVHSQGVKVLRARQSGHH